MKGWNMCVSVIQKIICVLYNPHFRTKHALKGKICRTFAWHLRFTNNIYVPIYYSIYKILYMLYFLLLYLFPQVLFYFVKEYSLQGGLYHFIVIHILGEKLNSFLFQHYCLKLYTQFCLTSNIFYFLSVIKSFLC